MTLLMHEVVAIAAAVDTARRTLVSRLCASQLIFDDERWMTNVDTLTLPRCGRIFFPGDGRARFCRTT